MKSCPVLGEINSCCRVMLQSGGIQVYLELNERITSRKTRLTCKTHLCSVATFVREWWTPDLFDLKISGSLPAVQVFGSGPPSWVRVCSQRVRGAGRMVWDKERIRDR